MSLESDEMNRKIISVFVILILGLSVGLQAASATPAAKTAYNKTYPTAPDPDCGGGLCHLAAPEDGGTNLTAYGTMLNNTANGDYGKSFKNLNATQKQAVLIKAGSGTKPPVPPVPELPTIALSMIGLLYLFHKKNSK
jgi:hypothetical protein